MLERILPFTHKKILEVLRENDLAIDATIGNGNDTLFLCENCQFVYGFDIQQKAIEATTALLKENNISNYELFNKSHSLISDNVTKEVAVIMFNLGYLPGHQKQTITTADSTVKAIQSGLRILKKGGLISLVVYTGHKGGLEESAALELVTSQLNSKDYTVLKYQFTNKKNAPYIIFIEKH